MKSNIQKTKTQESKFFFDKWANAYDANILTPFLHIFQNLAIREMHTTQNTQTLDIACGTGFLLTKINGKKYGVDMSEEMLSIAKQKNIQNLVLKKSFAQKLTFENNFFDYVVCTEAFHHFEDPLLVLKEIKRVLKKDGILIIVDVNFFRLFNFLAEKYEPGCVHIYSKSDFQNVFKTAQLKLIKQERRRVFAIVNVARK